MIKGKTFIQIEKLKNFNELDNGKLSGKLSKLS
jgi:hypothetical protein